jgi:hypothetical protein
MAAAAACFYSNLDIEREIATFGGLSPGGLAESRRDRARSCVPCGPPCCLGVLAVCRHIKRCSHTYTHTHSTGAGWWPTPSAVASRHRTSPPAPASRSRGSVAVFSALLPFYASPCSAASRWWRIALAPGFAGPLCCIASLPHARSLPNRGFSLSLSNTAPPALKWPFRRTYSLSGAALPGMAGQHPAPGDAELARGRGGLRIVDG